MSNIIETKYLEIHLNNYKTTIKPNNIQTSFEYKCNPEQINLYCTVKLFRVIKFYRSNIVFRFDTPVNCPQQHLRIIDCTTGYILSMIR